MNKNHLAFGVCATMLSFTLLTGCQLAQEAPNHADPSMDVSTTSTTESSGKNIELMNGQKDTALTMVADLEYYPGAKGYFVRPEAEGTYPGVVMIHENRGLRPEIKEAAEALAQEGYMVLAVDLLGGTAEDQEAARALTAQFNADTGLANMQAAVRYLRERGASKIASLGWCFGGRQSMALAISGEQLDATVVYYGSNMATTTTELEPIDWPVLGVFGDADQAIPMEKVNELKTSLASLNIPHEVYVYPGVGHAFANPSGANYAPEETKDAWAKTLVFLDAYLK